MEAAELLGIGERTFPRWRQRFETRRGGTFGSSAGQGVGQAGSDRSRGRGRGFVPRALSGLYRQAFSRASGDAAQLLLGLHLDEDFSSFEGSSGEGEAARRAPAQAERRPMPGMMLHQDGSRHVWLEGQPALDLIVTLDDATGAIYSAFLIEEEGTASTFRALRETFAAHGLPMSLYTDRGSHYFHTSEAGGKIDRSRLTQVGRALEQLGVEHIGAYSPQARGRSERAFQTLQDRLVKELRLAGITSVEAANAFLRDVYPPTYNARFATPAAEPVRPSPRSRASTSTRSCACTRSARSATTIACPTARSSCKSRKARCARTSSRRRSRSTSIRTAPTPSSTGRAASAGMTRRERSGSLNAPLKSARRRACRNVDNANALPTVPQEYRTRRSGHLMCYQNRTS